MNSSEESFLHRIFTVAAQVFFEDVGVRVATHPVAAIVTFRAVSSHEISLQGGGASVALSVAVGNDFPSMRTTRALGFRREDLGALYSTDTTVGQPEEPLDNELVDELLGILEALDSDEADKELENDQLLDQLLGQLLDELSLLLDDE